MESSDGFIYKKGMSGQQKRELIENWKHSGKTKMAFAKEYGINYYTFISWLQPKKPTKSSKHLLQQRASFTEVLPGISTPGNLFARISFGKTSVDLYQVVSADFLLRLMNA